MQLPIGKPGLDIERELEILAHLPVAKLRERWRALFKTEPPSAFGPDLLRRKIAYHIQERAFGGLSSSIRRELEQLAKVISKASSGRIELPRRIKAGAVLIREWKSKTYRVTVHDDGFVFEEEKYTSLSEIARKITGVRWNGPRFFGLRNSAQRDAPKLQAQAAEVGVSAR